MNNEREMSSWTFEDFQKDNKLRKSEVLTAHYFNSED